jgi:hypothetical protein
MDGDVPTAARYWAFISYSHKDAVVGRRLHGRLERYVLPRRLVGRATARGAVPRRLSPIFRDREELPAAHDLSVAVRSALAASNALIVLCSPHAAASPWVAREVEFFRALHPERPILAALYAGEPEDAFPSALLACAEPLAADFRAGRDGGRLALLKLVAGLSGVGLDELLQRDLQRRLRSVTAVTATALAAVLAMGLLTVLALSSRDEARRQKGLAVEALGEARLQRGRALAARDEARRQEGLALQALNEVRRQRAAAVEARADAEDQQLEAETMVEFMRTELPRKLTGDARLEAQIAINQRAFDYYSSRDVGGLPAASAARRARVATALGDGYKKTGDLDAAMMTFAQSYRATNRLMAQNPGNPRYTYDHAQNEFHIGDVAYARADWKAAKAGYQRYNALAERLIALKPDNLEYRKEIGYAQGNLCAAALKMRDTPAAAEYCGRSLKTMSEVERWMQDDRREMAFDLANRHAWLADVHHKRGNLDAALAERVEQEKILTTLLAERPGDSRARADWIALQLAYASLSYSAHDPEGGLSRLERVRPEAAALVAGDRDVARAKELLKRVDLSIAYLRKSKGDTR